MKQSDRARPFLICSATVLFTTALLATINVFVPTSHLVLVYLLPIVFIAIFFNVIAAALTAFACALAAAYFLLPPLFSFYIDDPLDLAELGFMIVLAILAGQHFPPAHMEPP